MQFSELIQKRYSVRAYKPDPVEDEKLQQVLEAARLAPTAANRQPVRVVVVKTAGRAAEFSGYYGARDGRVAIEALIAPNDMPGLWRIHAEELASGLTGDAYVRVAAER